MENLVGEMVQKYGPLLPLAKAALILDRSPDGFRVSLHRNDELSQKLRAIKFHVGRRVYFPTDQFFELIFNQAAS